MNRGIIAIATLIAVAGCGQQAKEDATQSTETATETAEVASGPAAPAAFAQCAACHVVKKDAPHGLGPNLWGVYGTKAGELADYNFSPAMKASGLVWDDAGLDAYLTSPRTAVPGTKMSYAGMADAAKRAEIIAYLKASK